jgi:hypothetical protein
MKHIKLLFGVLTITAALATQAHAQAILTNGLVAYYPFNGNANDQFGHGNAGTLYNGAYYTNGIVGEPNAAVYCNGLNAYVYFGKNDAVYPNQVLTWSAWFRSEGTSGIIFWDDDATPGGDRSINVGPNVDLNPILWGGSQGQFIASGTNVVPLNRWSHAVFTSDAGGQSLYLDGELVAYGNTIIENHAGRSSVSVGAGNYTSGSGPNYVYGARFHGAISKVRIYNRALSGSEVRQLFDYESAPRVNLIKAVKTAFSNMSLGTNYQLQVSSDMSTWTNQGAPFTATNPSMIYPQYWDVDNWSQLYFRLQVSP